jgi:two-component system, OmpR family, response regulator
MRILVVEDDPVMGPVLLQGLEEAGFSADLVTCGQDAVAAGLTTRFDVISLDLMLPGEDGFAVCAHLRGRGVDTPVLVLTARDAVADRVHGLESGADDYLVKPFAFEEYVARIRALVRRQLAMRAAIIELAGIRLDTSGRTATIGGTSLILTAKELAILECFMHHPGQLLDKEQIAQHVWNYELDGESNLVEVYVGRLRRKLLAAGVPDPISTVRHAGYRFESDAP